MNKPTKTLFRKAVDYLKDQGTIKRDQELLQILGITSKGTLSNYLKFGLPTHLQEKFQNKFKLELSRFSGEAPSEAKNLNGSAFNVSVQDYVEALKEQKRLAEEHAKNLNQILTTKLEKLEQIDSNLSYVLGGVHQISLYTESLRTTSLRSLARLEKKKENDLKLEADKMIVEIMKSRHGQDNKVASGKLSKT